MNTNKVLLKFLSAMLFAALVICLLSSMLNDGRVFANPDIEFVKSPGGDGALDNGIFGGGSGVLGSNGYLIIAIVGIVIVVAVLLIIKFVIPKLRVK